MLNQPSYIKAYERGVLKERAVLALDMLKNCNACPHQCSVNRIEGERGFCRAGKYPVIASAQPHFGEEDVLVGSHGSGTIFFSFCNLQCVFCQNCELSYHGEGHEITVQELAKVMLQLQDHGCHNINLVSPSHYVPQILDAIYHAARGGLHIPIVYNSGGYDLVDILKLLDGIIDIYMPDIKFADEKIARKYTKSKNYPSIVKNAVKEMYRQVGDLKVNEEGVAYRGLLVRHLILPNNLSGTKEVVQFLAEEISPDTFINIMEQYYPAHFAVRMPELERHITREEYEEAIELARAAGLRRVMS